MRASPKNVIEAVTRSRRVLQDLGLLLDFNESVIEKIGERKQRVSWAVTGVRPDLGAYPDSTIEEYVSFLRGRHYQALLIDGSILQISYDIYRSQEIIGARLLWYPCPADFEQEELESATIEEIVLTTPTEKLGCRAPIRIDFAPSFAAENHSATHMHFGYERTRLPVQRSMEPMRFLGFILRTVYPDHWSSVAGGFDAGDWAAADKLSDEDRYYGCVSWHPKPVAA